VVSIVLVTYNRAQRLRLSIRDILNQTFKDFELIICDDCSPDETEEVCREFIAEDNRVKYFRHASNNRMPANLNFGICKAQFPYVAILHDGDRFKPDLIQQWYNGITSKDSVGFVFNSIGVTDEHENIVFAYHDFKEGIIDKDYLLKDVYFRRWQFNSPVYGEAMVRKELVIENGLLKSKYGFYADVDLWMQLLHTHDAYYCADTLITGPAKTLQPRLFDDHLVKTFNYMFIMQLNHRRKAFAKQPLRLAAELLLFYAQAFMNLNYKLLLLVKNFSFHSFMDARKLLKQSFLFVIPWLTILFLYPILYPFLKLFQVLKKSQSRPMLVVKAKSILVSILSLIEGFLRM
jgi:glycosyltransferase involved in cell wall biosynthesis